MAREEGVHLVLIFIKFGQTEFHVYLLVFSQGIYNVLNTLLYHLPNGLLVVELRFLRQIAYAIARRKDHITLIALVEAGDNLQQG